MKNGFAGHQTFGLMRSHERSKVNSKPVNAVENSSASSQIAIILPSKIMESSHSCKIYEYVVLRILLVNDDCYSNLIYRFPNPTFSYYSLFFATTIALPLLMA
jgi:hypothetical protein